MSPACHLHDPFGVASLRRLGLHHSRTERRSHIVARVLLSPEERRPLPGKEGAAVTSSDGQEDCRKKVVYRVFKKKKKERNALYHTAYADFTRNVSLAGHIGQAGVDWQLIGPPGQ